MNRLIEKNWEVESINELKGLNENFLIGDLTRL
jgi:hypothetical protein